MEKKIRSRFNNRIRQSTWSSKILLLSTNIVEFRLHGQFLELTGIEFLTLKV